MPLPRSNPLSTRHFLLLPAIAFALAVSSIACTGGEDETADDPTSAPASATATAEPSRTPQPTATAVPYNGPAVRLMIPKLGVDTPVEVLGVTADNYLATPENPLNAGWYGNGLSDVPGWNGNAVFSAHYNQLLGGVWHDAPFRYISTLQEGDEIVVVMANGSAYRYKVTNYTRYEEASFPTGDLLDGKGKPSDAEWITLITCGGRTSQLDANGVGSFLDRDVVIAERVDNKPRETT